MIPVASHRSCRLPAPPCFPELLLVQTVCLLAFSFGLSAQEMVRVPETDAPPVLLDGTFSVGEWDDALTVEGGGVTLYLKQEAGHVFIAVGSQGLTSPVTNLFIQPVGGEIHQLHVSAQLGERVLPSDGSEPPPFTWGFSSLWYANEVRWDERRRRQLVDEGMDQGQAQVETLFPYDGFEFQIRREKFGVSEWRIRVDVPSAGREPLVFPRDTQPGDSTGWLVLNLGA